MSGNIISVEDKQNALLANYTNIAYLRAKKESYKKIAAKYNVTVNMLKKFIETNELVKQTIAEYELNDAEFYTRCIEDASKGYIRDEEGRIIQTRNPNGDLALKMLERIQKEQLDESKEDNLSIALNHWEVYNPEKARELLKYVTEAQKLIEEALLERGRI
jgi:hypothetical protein